MKSEYEIRQLNQKRFLANLRILAEEAVFIERLHFKHYRDLERRLEAEAESSGEFRFVNMPAENTQLNAPVPELVFGMSESAVQRLVEEFYSYSKQLFAQMDDRVRNVLKQVVAQKIVDMDPDTQEALARSLRDHVYEPAHRLVNTAMQQVLQNNPQARMQIPSAPELNKTSPMPSPSAPLLEENALNEEERAHAQAVRAALLPRIEARPAPSANNEAEQFSNFMQNYLDYGVIEVFARNPNPYIRDLSHRLMQQNNLNPLFAALAEQNRIFSGQVTQSITPIIQIIPSVSRTHWSQHSIFSENQIYQRAMEVAQARLRPQMGGGRRVSDEEEKLGQNFTR